jgi:hypothetical protein
VIEWVHFPKSDDPPELVRGVVRTFEAIAPAIDSANHQLSSDEVLAAVAPGLQALGFLVERGKRKEEKVHVPVLFGRSGRVEKAFEADAYHSPEGFVVEVEAGRGVVNNQFLKDLFQACMMHDVNYLAIAIRNLYGGGGRSSKDFEAVVTFFETLYASDRLQLPLKGITVIGY